MLARTRVKRLASGGKQRYPRDGVLYGILALSVVLHSYHIAYPAWDYHNWRQCITLMVARDFANHGFHLLHPQVAWVGRGGPTGPSYFSAEFSIMSILAALLYKIFGAHDAVARMVVIAFSLLGIWSLYNLLRRHAGVFPARIAAFVYAVLPYQLFFGRVFMPEIPAQGLALVALDILDRWTIDRKWKTLFAAAGLTALAILEKLTVAFVVVPALYLFWEVYRKRLLAPAESYVFFAISGVPVTLWYRHAADMAHQSGFAIMQPGFLGRQMGLWLQPTFIRQIATALSSEALSPLGLALMVVGLFWPSRSRVAWVFRLWTISAALLIFSVPALLPENHYYLAVFLPASAALTGLALSSLPRKAYWVLPVALGGLVIGGIRCAIPLYTDDRAPYDLGLVLGKLSSNGDLIITESGGSPNVLYYSGRRGWMLSGLYNPALADRLAGLGARYYASAFGSVPEGKAFFCKLDQLFERLTSDGAPWPIYDLKPSARLTEAEIQTPRSVNFANQIELHGTSLRRLLDKPAAFELVFEWRCLKTPETEIRGFIHVNDSADRTIYSQDHWPLGTRTPVPQWKPHDAIRERYILVLPESLAAGRYQLRVGWYDPIRQTRLMIVSPGISDGQERAMIAEIETYGPRRFRWFSVR